MRAYKKRLVTTVTVSYSATATIRGSTSCRLPFGYHLVMLSAIVCASRHQSKFLTFTFIIIAKCLVFNVQVLSATKPIVNSLPNYCCCDQDTFSASVFSSVFSTYFGTLDKLFSAFSFIIRSWYLPLHVSPSKNSLISHQVLIIMSVTCLLSSLRPKKLDNIFF